MKQVRGWGCVQGCWADRGDVLMLKGSTNVHVLVSLESVCACTSELLLLPAKENERDLSVLMFYASPVGRCY